MLLISACSSTDDNLSQDTRLSDRGYIAMNEGNLLDAEIYLQAALQMNPVNPYALLNMGVVYQRTDRIDQARQMYAKVVGLQPDQVAAGSNEADLSGKGLADIARANLAALAQDDLVAVRQIDASKRDEAARFLEILQLYRDAGAISERDYAEASEGLLARVPSSAPAAAATVSPTAATVEAKAASAASGEGSDLFKLAANNPKQGGDELFAHIASYRSAENAERGWGLLFASNGDLLGAMSHRVLEVDLGPDKGIFYRLLAGPLPDRAAADSLCRALKSRNLYCTPLKESGADDSKKLQTAAS